LLSLRPNSGVVPDKKWLFGAPSSSGNSIHNPGHTGEGGQDKYQQHNSNHLVSPKTPILGNVDIARRASDCNTMIPVRTPQETARNPVENYLFPFNISLVMDFSHFPATLRSDNQFFG
jgi:hypothetical protein